MTFVGEHRRASVRDLARPVGCHGGVFFFAFGWRGQTFQAMASAKICAVH
jgi:hypothetical protein